MSTWETPRLVMFLGDHASCPRAPARQCFQFQRTPVGLSMHACYTIIPKPAGPRLRGTIRDGRHQAGHGERPGYFLRHGLLREVGPPPSPPPCPRGAAYRGGSSGSGKVHKIGSSCREGGQAGRGGGRSAGAADRGAGAGGADDGGELVLHGPGEPADALEADAALAEAFGEAGGAGEGRRHRGEAVATQERSEPEGAGADGHVGRHAAEHGADVRGDAKVHGHLRRRKNREGGPGWGGEAHGNECEKAFCGGNRASCLVCAGAVGGSCLSCLSVRSRVHEEEQKGGMERQQSVVVSLGLGYAEIVLLDYLPLCDCCVCCCTMVV